VIDPKSNLVNELRPEGVSLQEFLAVLASRFPSSSLDTETNFVLYPKDPPHELRVEFRKDGVLSGIFALPALSEKKLNSIRQDILKELSIARHSGSTEWSFSAFTRSVARGGIGTDSRFFRTTQAPTVPVLYGDHPFVIEYESSRTRAG